MPVIFNQGQSNDMTSYRSGIPMIETIILHSPISIEKPFPHNSTRFEIYQNRHCLGLNVYVQPLCDYNDPDDQTK